MTPIHPKAPPMGRRPAGVARILPPVPLAPLQPILKRIVHRIARDHPGMFNRLGPYKSSTYLIDPVNLPFALVLRPDPDDLMFRAVRRTDAPEHVARIAGGFLDLLHLMDCDLDGDALFFARGLDVTGNTEAVVCLRNALDDVEGSIAGDVAAMFGPPGRFVLTRLLAMGEKPAEARS